MSEYLLLFSIATALSFLLNFPPQKIQYILLGGQILFFIALIAYLIDTGSFTMHHAFDWGIIVFSLIGYICGLCIAKGARKLFGVDWK